MASKAHADDPVSEQHTQGHHEPHVISIPVLLGTFAALIVLTVITVGATAVDLGAAGNLAVALIIAAIKAILVALIFMHLWFDQKYNAMIFGGSLIFVILFVAFTTIDASRYQDDIRAVDADTAEAGAEAPAEAPAEAAAPTEAPAPGTTAAPAAPPLDDSVKLPTDEGPRTAPTAH